MTHEYWFMRGNVAGLAVELRMHVNGSADNLKPAEVDSLAEYLRARTAAWAWRNPTTPFDCAVYQVVRGALAEYDEKRAQG